MVRKRFDVACCTVQRLMRGMDLAGIIRGKSVKTTVQDKAVPCPLDHVNRNFKAPEQKHRLRRQPLHWTGLPRSPARTDTDSHAARQVAVLARITCPGWTVPICVFPSSSTPPELGCCDDRLNPPNIPASSSGSSWPTTASPALSADPATSGIMQRWRASSHHSRASGSGAESTGRGTPQGPMCSITSSAS